MREGTQAAPVPAAEVPALLTGGTGRSLLTYYDDATGERTDLSPAVVASWVARTAALLREGCGLWPGSRVAVLLPPHWQTATVLLGAWAAGMAVSVRPAATAGLPVLEPGADEPLDATFVSWRRLDDWLEDVPEAVHRYVLGLAPGVTPMAEAPPGYLDYVSEVARFSDRPLAEPPVDGSDPATVDGTSYGAWRSVALGTAEAMGLRPGDRVLIDAEHSEQPLIWLLAPLAAGASVVLCANLDESRLDARIAAEKVTRVLL
jgi:uncharacterized protein (TIGR03089 family)